MSDETTNGSSAAPWFSAQECQRRAHTSIRRLMRFHAMGAVERKRSDDDAKWLYNLEDLKAALAKSDEQSGVREREAAAVSKEEWLAQLLAEATGLLRTAQVQQREMFDRGVAYEKELRQAYRDEISATRARIKELESREVEVAKTLAELADEKAGREIARDIAQRRQDMLERAVANISQSAPDILGMLARQYLERPKADAALKLWKLNELLRTEKRDPTDAEIAELARLTQELDAA